LFCALHSWLLDILLARSGTIYVVGGEDTLPISKNQFGFSNLLSLS